MSIESHLFGWIKAQEQAGELDSSGVFTIEKSKAWEKLGALSLPFEHAWALKLVQAAVACGSGLRITQSRRETLFLWTQSPTWTHDVVEGALLGLAPEGERALSHLAGGLRSLAMASKLPFALQYSDGSEAIWTGRGFHLEQSEPQDVPCQLGVRISHYLVGESSSALSFDNLDANRRSASIAKALTDHCHWAPANVSLDGRPLGNIFADRVFGASTLRQPLFLMQAKPVAEIPDLRASAHLTLPSAGLSGAPEVTGVSSALASLSRGALEPCLALALVSAFLKKVRVGKSYVYESERQPSQLVWVADGVEVAREDLGVGKLPAAMMVACSAEGLPTDLSGLTPRDTEAKAARRHVVMREIRSCLAATAPLDAQVEDTTQPLFFGVLLVGGLLTLANPPVGLATMGFGGLSMAMAQSRRTGLEAELDRGLADLRTALAVESRA